MRSATWSRGFPRQWSLGSSEGGFVFMNNGIEAYPAAPQRHRRSRQGARELDPLKASTEDVIGACHHFLDPLIEHLEGLEREEGDEYRKLYGSGAGLRYYRKLQQAVRDARPTSTPPGSTSG